jgi:Mce-associated membrane protein
VPRRAYPAKALKLPVGANVSRAGGILSAPASISVAESDELAQAEARAEAARARAVLLREQAEAASRGVANDSSDPAAEEQAESSPSRWHALRRLRHPSRKGVALAAAVAFSCTTLVASGYVVWYHRHAAQESQRRAEFAAAAHDAIVTMLTVNAPTARADVQRFIDDTTGQFKVGILLGAEDYVKAVEQSKGNSKGTVQAVAVQSMTSDSAIVLVAAKSEASKPGEAKPESRSMRIVVNVERDGGQLRISRVEFVP